MLAMANILPLMNLLANMEGGFWMPPQGSQVARDVDWLFFFVMWICVFFFVLILILLVAFAWKYRYREGQPVLDAPKHNTALELTWTFIPTVIVVVIFFYGFKGYLNMSVPPPDAYEIDVTAHMWGYTFGYDNGEISDSLHIPVGVPVKFVMTSNDVIHGFYLRQFRIKKDIVPGRYNMIWIQAEYTGDSDVYCTQYCGQDHSTMRTVAHVETREDFHKFVKSLGGAMTPLAKGEKLYRVQGCNGCHSVDGSETGKAPTWKDLYGSTVTFSDGTPPMLADENYLHLMITKSNAHTIAPYAAVMPSFAGMLSEQDVGAIITYIKSISKNYHPSLPPAGGASSSTSPATLPAAGSAK